MGKQVKAPPKQWEPKGKEPVRQHYGMATEGLKKGEKK